MLDALIPAAVGILGVLVGAYLSSRASRSLSATERLGRLSAEAFRDLIAAIARNAQVLGALEGAGTPELRDHYTRQVTESRIEAAKAKALLGAYASPAVVRELRIADDGGFGSPDAQAALLRLLLLIRSDIRPGEELEDPSDLEVLLFRG